MENRKREAFTLGEVLIAVLVIGIISVLTLPSLIKGIQAKSRMALFKNTVANIDNAVKKEFFKNRTTDITKTNIYNNPEAFLQTFDLAKQSGSPFAASYKRLADNKTMEVPIPSSAVTGQSAALLKNGAGIGIINDKENKKISVVIDLTGPGKPNIIGSDYFILKMEQSAGNGFSAGDISSIEGAGDSGDTNEGLAKACKLGNGEACFRLVDLSDYDPDYLK